MMRTILILLSVVALNTSAFAQSNTTTAQAENAAMQASIDARNNFVTALQNKEFAEITHQGFDFAIRELAEQLRTVQQDSVMADSLLNQWNESSAGAGFASQIEFVLHKRDLGDHDPLFPWIQDFLKKMADKYGTIILTLPIVKDIEMLNFAIPVVFNPHGSAWQIAGVDSRIEYRKHFIPFANLITYYVTLYGCKYLLAHNGLSQMKQICTKAATKLEFVMGRYIAPVVSDWIFKAANQSINISDEQLGYTNASDLRRAIQN